MALLKLSLRTQVVHQGKRLDQVLAEWLPVALNLPVSKGKARKLIVAGAVYLNSKRVRIASKMILPDAKIDVYVDLGKLKSDSTEQDISFRMTPERILFEDDFIIVVDKPAGIPTQPTLDEARLNLFAVISRFLNSRPSASGPQYLGLHHRLDRDTSGVILFTKAKEANAGVAQAFSTHRAQKTYQALVSVEAGAQKFASNADSWITQNYLGKLKSAGKKSKFGAVRSGGDLARTEFQVLEKLSAGGLSILQVEAKPLTGRTHQIRVHLSEQGLPILGDEFYGGRRRVNALAIPRVMLHAAQLIFPHPVTGKELRIESPLPDDFRQCLQAIQEIKSHC